MLHGQKELKLGRQLVFAIQAVGEVDAPHSAVGMNLHPQSLYVVRAVSATGEIREIELDLIPALVQPHGHRADERLHACRGLREAGASERRAMSEGARAKAYLIVRCSETTTNIFIVQNLNFESEVLLQVLDDHDEERQLDAERLLGVGRACDKVGAHL